MENDKIIENLASFEADITETSSISLNNIESQSLNEISNYNVEAELLNREFLEPYNNKKPYEKIVTVPFQFDF